MDRVASIVLAAGSSSRLGSPKQLIRLGGETLLERAVRVAFEADCYPIFGVISAELALAITPHHMIPIVNREPMEGIASSIRCGVRALQRADACLSGVIILACDQPSVTVEHLQRLASGGNDALASAYAGRRGIPAYFPAGIFEKLLTLEGDTGAREFLKSARVVDLPHGELDIDTTEDLERVQKFYERETSAGPGSPSSKRY